MNKVWSVPFKKVVLGIAESTGNDRKACREFNVFGSSFYLWRKALRDKGTQGLILRKPIARSHQRQLAPNVVEKIMDLRKNYHLGPERITWYLERYHGVKTSCSSVYRTLIRQGLCHPPKGTDRRAIHTRRYAKEVPGHHVQVDVKFVTLKSNNGKKTRRFQFATIDDGTRMRALRIYPRHNQQNAIKFIDYVVEKSPFRIHTIRTGRGHEF